MDPTRPFRFLADAIFPPRCLVCETLFGSGEAASRAEHLCGACREKIAVFDAPFCPECGARAPLWNPGCHLRPPFLLLAAASYENPVMRELLWRLKYDFSPAAAEPIAQALLAYLTRTEFFERVAASPYPALVIPIPLHKRKERSRGFNQSALVARALLRAASACGAPFPEIGEGILIRTRPTRSQTECKNAKERAENIAGCFSVRHPERIKGKDIVLVDDVFTTGGTTHEAARTLKENGAKKIFALVAAKA